MDNGWVIVHRRVYSHPIFNSCQEAAAFVWMIHRASWRPTRVHYKRRAIVLERGQLAITTRDMARDWGWSEAHVRRFFRRLSSDAVIDADVTHGITVITICNYDKYQALPKACDAEATHARRTRDAQNNKGNKGKEVIPPLTPPQPGGTRLAEKWQPDAADREYATESGYSAEQIDRLADDFREYFTGPDAKQPRKKSWPLAWRRWVRTDRERGDPTRRGNQRGQGRETVAGRRGPDGVVQTILRVSDQIARHQSGGRDAHDDTRRDDG